MTAAPVPQRMPRSTLCLLYTSAIYLILDKGNVDFPGILAIAKEGAIVIGITAAAQWIMHMCNNRMTYNIVRDIRRDALERIEHLPLSYICLLYTSRCV